MISLNLILSKRPKGTTELEIKIKFIFNNKINNPKKLLLIYVQIRFIIQNI
jgi:hypothetical protein